MVWPFQMVVSVISREILVASVVSSMPLRWLGTMYRPQLLSCIREA